MSRCCTWLLKTLTFCCVRFTFVYFYLIVKLPMPPSFYPSSLYLIILIWGLESLKHVFYITVFQCKPYNGSYFCGSSKYWLVSLHWITYVLCWDFLLLFRIAYMSFIYDYNTLIWFHYCRDGTECVAWLCIYPTDTPFSVLCRFIYVAMKVVSEYVSVHK